MFGSIHFIPQAGLPSNGSHVVQLLWRYTSLKASVEFGWVRGERSFEWFTPCKLFTGNGCHLTPSFPPIKRILFIAEEAQTLAHTCQWNAHLCLTEAPASFARHLGWTLVHRLEIHFCFESDGMGTELIKRSRAIQERKKKILQAHSESSWLTDILGSQEWEGSGLIVGFETLGFTDTSFFGAS